jgi:hypothetical protein
MEDQDQTPLESKLVSKYIYQQQGFLKFSSKTQIFVPVRNLPNLVGRKVLRGS